MLTFITYGVDVNNKFSFCLFQSDDNASFLRAARGGNLEKVLEYLKANTDINTCNAVRPIHHFTDYGRVIRFFLFQNIPNFLAYLADGLNKFWSIFGIFGCNFSKLVLSL